METWDALNSRRQTREYADEALDPGLVDRILEAARRSGSSRNGQPWHFVVVTDAETKAGLARTWQGAQWVTGAPIVVAVLADEAPEPWLAPIVEYDLGQAVGSMMTAAADLGVGFGQTAVTDQDLARQLLGFPEGVYCSKLVTLGHAARALTPIQNPDRRPFDDVVHRHRWS